MGPHPQPLPACCKRIHNARVGLGLGLGWARWAELGWAGLGCAATWRLSSCRELVGLWLACSASNLEPNEPCHDSVPMSFISCGISSQGLAVPPLPVPYIIFTVFLHMMNSWQIAYLFQSFVAQLGSISSAFAKVKWFPLPFTTCHLPPAISIALSFHTLIICIRGTTQHSTKMKKKLSKEGGEKWNNLSLNAIHPLWRPLYNINNYVYGWMPLITLLYSEYTYDSCIPDCRNPKKNSCQCGWACCAFQSTQLSY